MAKSSRPVSMSKWAQTLADNYLLCRDIGHTWMPHEASYDPKLRLYTQTLRCPRCTTVRRRALSRSGEIMGSSYTYPETYRAPHGSGVTTAPVRAELRVFSLTRLLDAAKAANAVVNDANKPKPS